VVKPWWQFTNIREVKKTQFKDQKEFLHVDSFPAQGVRLIRKKFLSINNEGTNLVYDTLFSSVSDHCIYNKKMKINSIIVRHRTLALKNCAMSKMILSYLFSIDHFTHTKMWRMNWHQ
jgi:hypothetical protein